MELHHPPDLTLAPAVERYLARLPLSYEQHDALAAAATEAGEGAREQLQAATQPRFDGAAGVAARMVAALGVRPRS